MKKLFILSLVAIFMSLGLTAFAEQSGISMGGKYFTENQVFVNAYNSSGSAISSNYVVIIDTTATAVASGSTLGAYITTTTTGNDTRVLGVTDETISAGTVGRVCVRGPHKVYLTGLAGASVGATLATCSTAGAGDMPAYSARYKGGEFGVLLSTTVIGNGEHKTPAVADGYKLDDGTSNYWVWVGKR